jgi:hypothetical protein
VIVTTMAVPAAVLADLGRWPVAVSSRLNVKSKSNWKTPSGY